MLAAHFRTMAAYNRWANRRLYDAAARLADADYRADRKANHRSLHGTLNYILLIDRLWLMRLTGRGEVPAEVDAILYERLADLTVAREAEDERLSEYVAVQDGPALARTITYRNRKDLEMTTPLHAVLAHLFNHQSQFRGEALALLKGLDRETPSLDLVEFLRITR